MKTDRSQHLLILALLGTFALAAVPATAQQIVQSRGVDAQVDYASLTRFGPWDDRNYNLTRDDLALLADNEAELYVLVPAFYRVELRRKHPSLLREGSVQYPRSTLPYFRMEYGGYLVNGRLYKSVHYNDGVYTVGLDDEEGITEEAWQEKFLTGEVRLSSPEGAAESAIAINPVNTDIVIAGSNGPITGQTMHYSTDGGETWTVAEDLTGGECCDPTVAWSTDGTKAYTATLGGSQVWFYRSRDGGRRWNDLETQTPGDDRREIGAGAFADKEYMHVDISPTSPYNDRIYISWHESTEMFTVFSSDFGNTWSSPYSFGTSSSVQGFGSDLTSDKDGNVYHFWPAIAPRDILVAKSTNGGVSWEDAVKVADTQAAYEWPLPAMDSRRAWVHVSAGVDLSDGTYGNSLYAAWTDTTAPDNNSNASANHGRIQVAYSRDGGDNWATTTPHETADSMTVDRFNPWLAVGPDGKVYVIYYDTRQDLPDRRDVDLYFSFSTDGAQTWSTPERLTSVTSPHINDGFEWGDYNGLDVAMNDLIAIYTDNRTEAGRGGDSVDVYAVGRNLIEAAIFSDGFESGSSSAWSGFVSP